MRKRIIRIISLVLLLLAFIQIFLLSSQNAAESSKLSKSVTRKIILFLKNVKTTNQKNVDELIKTSESLVRNFAHFLIYIPIGIFSMSFISTYKIKTKYTILICFMFGLSYAILDEVYQGYIPGRASDLKDVFLDMLGVIFGLLLILIITRKNKD